MRRRASLSYKKVAAFLALLISPVVFIGLPLRVAFSEWFIEWEYSKPDFPEDPYGMDREYREYLAKLGLKAVTTEKGMEEFRRAKLPDGRRAFNEREIKHMEDVREILKVTFPVIYVSVPVFLFLLVLTGSTSAAGKVLVGGSLITLGILTLVLAFSLIDYELAFEVFHNYLFDPYSWRFRETDTLLRIYPMKFWFDGTIFVITASALLSFLSLALGAILLYFPWKLGGR